MEIFQRGSNSGITVFALKHLGELQKKVENNELRIQELEGETRDHRDQFSRINIVTSTLRNNIRELLKRQTEMVRMIKALGVVIRLIAINPTRVEKGKLAGLIKIALSALFGFIIQKIFLFDKISGLLIGTKYERVQVIVQLTSMVVLCYNIKKSLDGLF